MKKNLVLFSVLATAVTINLPVQATEYVHACKPTDVFATGNRVHVRCQHPEVNFSAPGREKVFFAVPTTNKELSDRLLALGSKAIVYNKWLSVWYSDSQAGPSFGCLEKDCRILTGISLHAGNLPTPRPYTVAPVD